MTNGPALQWSVWVATEASGDDLARLEADAFGAKSWGKNNLLESYVTPGVTVLMAGKENYPPVGFIIIRCAIDEAEILSIGVSADMRKRGVARALMTEAERFAMRQGAKSFFLDVAENNPEAMMLYQKLGFIEISRRRAYYRDGADGIIMAKEL